MQRLSLYHHRRQRGANSPLPHCGRRLRRRLLRRRVTTRGEFAPPSLRRIQSHREGHPYSNNEGRIRPSLIAASSSGPYSITDDAQRGANSPLPHCGQAAAELKAAANEPTRGEFAPPSLRPHLPKPFRPKLLATRGEFAPPSLRPIFRTMGDRGSSPNEGRIRPSLIAAHLPGGARL